MKLLFDANLSPRLVRRVADVYPESDHVFSHGIESDDFEIWSFAALTEAVIVTKDSDFQQLALVRGAPPKVIFIRLRNCTTGMIESLLRSQYPQIEAFIKDDSESLLLLPIQTEPAPSC